MKFRTIAAIDAPMSPLTHETPIMMLGSCFSDNIGNQLQRRLFNVMSNPFGTLYNPASINHILTRIATSQKFNFNDLVNIGDLYHSFDCHSSLSDADAIHMLTRLNAIVEVSRKFLASSKAVFLTFGTAWIYQLADDKRVVANCHKMPANTFHRRLLSVDECAKEINESVKTIHTIAPDAAIYLTVSPVRHLADGLHGNQISKSTLLLAIDQVVKTNQTVEYFPAYEMVIDDLRDYRFYAADMCHPSDVATDYVYERFSETFFDNATQELAAKCEKIARRFQHRQLTADDATYKKFKEETQQQLAALIEHHPYLRQAAEKLTRQ